MKERFAWSERNLSLWYEKRAKTDVWNVPRDSEKEAASEVSWVWRKPDHVAEETITSKNLSSLASSNFATLYHLTVLKRRKSSPVSASCRCTGTAKSKLLTQHFYSVLFAERSPWISTQNLILIDLWETSGVKESFLTSFSWPPFPWNFALRIECKTSLVQVAIRCKPVQLLYTEKFLSAQDVTLWVLQ